jgi:hypothetical protein
MTSVARRMARAASLVALALVLAGCRLDVVTEIDLDRAGGGQLSISVRIDGATLRELERLGVDPGADLAAALDPTAGWRTERVSDADGGLTTTLRREFADPAELVALLAALSEGLSADDPGLRADLAVVTGTRGAIGLSGTLGLSAPATSGVLIDGEPIGPAGDALLALTQEAVRAVLIVRTPGPITVTDADRPGARQAEWDLPVGSVRAVSLSAGPARSRSLPGVVALLAVLAVGGWWWRRRKSEPESEAGPKSDERA